MISEETMWCGKVRRILRYHVPNKLLSPEKLPHHVLLLFYPFRDEKESLSGFSPMYQNKLKEEGVQDIVNINKVKIELYSDLVDQDNSTTTWLTVKTHIANETPGAEYPYESNSEERETNKTSALSSFAPQILPDDEIAEGINSLIQNIGKSSVWFMHGPKIM